MFNCVMPVVRSVDDTVAVIWRGDIVGPGDLNLGYRLSTDGGISWNEISDVFPTDNYNLQKHTFVISDFRLFLIFSRIDQSELSVEFTKSATWGETWTEPAEICRIAETGRIDMAARGDTVHFVWAGRINWEDEWDIYYIRSTDAGESWSENTLLSTFDDRNSDFPSISINTEGNIIVVWKDYKYSEYMFTGDILGKYSYDGGESWSSEEQLTYNHFANPVRALWSSDSIHIAWEDWRHDQRDIFYKLSTDNGLTWGEDQRVEDDPETGRYPDIGLTDGHAHLVWSDWRDDPDDPGYGVYYSRWDDVVGIEEDKGIMPSDMALAAYPNPFNGNTTITYNILEGGEIEIFNIRGQKVRTLITAAKEGKTKWDARDALGNKVSSGIYFARACGANYNKAIKLIYLK
jgi:hypothetical protein